MIDLLRVAPEGRLEFRGQLFRCALGRAGIKGDKIEGDGATPAGRFALRQFFYRPDRRPAPHCALPGRALRREDGWCDDPDHSDYNLLVTLPHPARCESLWREDGVYDLLVTLGHNDDPPLAGHGSAIFLHLALDDFRPTEGCVALAADALELILAALGPGAMIEIPPPDHC